MKKYIVLTVLFMISLIGFISLKLYGQSLQADTKTQEQSVAQNETANVVQYEDEDGTKYELVESHADMVTFEYEDLKNRADVIALVTMEDSLADAKANITYDETGEYIFDYYQSRKVKVIHYYKNDLGAEETLEVIEPCAVYEKQLWTLEGYEPMHKGETYLLFLGFSDRVKMPGIISAGTSVIPLENLQEADDLDIAYKSVLDFGESDIKESDKKEILEQKKSTTKREKNGKKGKKVAITLQNYEYQCDYMKSEDGCSLNVE